ncbi:M protein trans-acting positive regulator [Enterococcus faecium]|nr:M protein trans-acting positive regulator [Enterococcus faecium]
MSRLIIQTALLKYLEASSNLSESISNVQEELSLSTFLLKKTIDKLKHDLQKFDLEKNLRVTVSELDICLEINGKCSSKALLSCYITDSLSMKMVLAFFQKKYISVENFAKQHHVSYSVAYKVLQRLKRNLKKYQIFFEKRKLTGNPKNIRLFLYNLFNSTEISFVELYTLPIIIKTEKMLKDLKQYYPLSAYEKKKLFHFLAINLLAEQADSLDIASNQSLFFSDIGFYHLKGVLGEKSVIFINKTLSWLYIHDKLDQKYLRKNEDETIEWLNERFIESFENQFNLLREETSQLIRRELTKIHFKLLHYTINKADEFPLDVSFFRENYPAFYCYLIEYINDLTSKRKELLQDKFFLFFSYLLLLINHIPIQLISEPVKIIIDFSYGAAYNQFIKKNLSLYINLNTEVIEAGKPEFPDVIITNRNNLYEESASQVVVWLDPPRAVDWGNLTKILLTIQEEKYKDSKIDKQIDDFPEEIIDRIE